MDPVPPIQSSTLRQDWSSVLCFSCGKSGYGVTLCPALNETVLFMLPGLKAERASCGYAMISPRVAAERRRAENGDRSGEGVQQPGSVMMLNPRTLVGVRADFAGGGGVAVVNTPPAVFADRVTMAVTSLLEWLLLMWLLWPMLGWSP